MLLTTVLTGCTPAATPAPTSPPATKPAATTPPAPTAVPPTATPAPSAATATPAPVKISMWTWMNPANNTPREVAFKTILDNFKRDYPYITVDIVSVPWQEIGTKWRASVEVGSAPDLIWNLKSVPDRAKFYTNLDESVLPKMAKEDLADIITMNTPESRVGTDANLAFPIWPSAGQILYYRKDLFAKAGIQAPLKTWDDFKKAAKALTMDTNGDGKIDVWGYGDGFGDKSAEDGLFFYSLADLLPSMYDVKTKTALFNSDQAAQSAQLVVDIVTSGAMPKDAIANDYETMLEQFQRGRFAMSAGGPHRYGSILQNVGFGKENLGIMPWPTWTGDKIGPGATGGGWEIAITKGTKNLEASATLLRYLMNKESSRLWMQTGQQVPNRKSLQQDPYLQKPENEVVALSLRILSERSYFMWPMGISTAETVPAIHEALQKMMLDGKFDKALLQKANDRVNLAQTK
jgi:multiple sugar transport system substrate-binding protein